MIPKPIDTHMKDVMKDAIRILFPLDVEPETVAYRHSWRTKKDLGEANSKVVTWQGWSANLQKLSDDGYRTLYIDYVPNLLSGEERLRLFGKDFTNEIAGLDSFIVMFVTNFSVNKRAAIQTGGFVARKIGPKLHACKIAAPVDFLSQSSLFWAAYLAMLANLQRAIRNEGAILQHDDVGTDRQPNWQNELDWEEHLDLLDL